MPVFTYGCCCFDSLREAAQATAIYTGVAGVVNLIINIWCLVTLHRLEDALEPNEEWNFIPPGFLPILYIELIFNLCFFGLAFVLAIGINRKFDGKNWMFTWVWGTGFFRAYEIFFGIYLLVWLGGHRIPDVLFVCPQFIFIVAYWGLSTAILVFGILGVLSYWEEVFNDVFGKEKRIKYFSMLTNIRNAGIQKSNQSMFSGTATPRSLFMSGYSESVASYPVKPSRGQLESTASAMSYQSVPAGPPPQRGPPSQGGPGPGGYPPRGPPSQSGYPPRGPPSQSGGYPPRGPPSQSGYPPRGPPSQSGYPPRGPPSQSGYPPRGPPSQSGGYPPRGPPPQGYPQRAGPPPQGPGGYPPPQRGGYRPPPQQGGRGYPPPQQQGAPGGQYQSRGYPGPPPQQGGMPKLPEGGFKAGQRQI